MVVALAAAAAALATGLADGTVLLVALTVLVGRASVGWARHETFVAACATCLLVPLSVSAGVTSGLAHLLSVAAAWLSATRLQDTPWSWVPWAVSFGLLPAYLSVRRARRGRDRRTTDLVDQRAGGRCWASCVHLLDALPDLVADHRARTRSLPLVVALRIGATRLL